MRAAAQRLLSTAGCQCLIEGRCSQELLPATCAAGMQRLDLLPSPQPRPQRHFSTPGSSSAVDAAAGPPGAAAAGSGGGLPPAPPAAAGSAASHPLASRPARGTLSRLQAQQAQRELDGRIVDFAERMFAADLDASDDEDAEGSGGQQAAASGAAEAGSDAATATDPATADTAAPAAAPAAGPPAEALSLAASEAAEAYLSKDKARRRRGKRLAQATERHQVGPGRLFLQGCMPLHDAIRCWLKQRLPASSPPQSAVTRCPPAAPAAPAAPAPCRSPLRRGWRSTPPQPPPSGPLPRSWAWRGSPFLPSCSPPAAPTC
jgi:hypothetical protein